MQIGSRQVPISDAIEGLITHDDFKTHTTYMDFVNAVSDIPAALFGSCISPQECVVDCIIVGDSSFAMVKDHDELGSSARLSFGELLQAKDRDPPSSLCVCGVEVGKGPFCDRAQHLGADGEGGVKTGWWSGRHFQVWQS